MDGIINLRVNQRMVNEVNLKKVLICGVIYWRLKSLKSVSIGYGSKSAALSAHAYPKSYK